MAPSDSKIQKLLSRTNLDQLLTPPAKELNFNPPVETKPPPAINAPRSTVDPLQVNYASADIAARFRNPRVSNRLRVFGLLLLGGPLLLSGFVLILTVWFGPDLGQFRKPESAGGLIVNVLLTIGGLGVAGFWPCMIFANKYRSAKNEDS